MEGPFLPEGSGGEEPPEEPRQLHMWDERVRLQQEKRLLAFEQVLDHVEAKPRKRRNLFNDYTAKNCEESWGGRPEPKAGDRVG